MEQRFALPGLPFERELQPSSCQIGAQISVRATPYDDQRRSITLVLAPENSSPDAALIVELHLPYGGRPGRLITKCRLNSTESSPIEKQLTTISVNKEFVLSIRVVERAFEVTLDNVFQTQFVHRVQPGDIRRIMFDGPVICNEVVIVPPKTGMPLPPSYADVHALSQQASQMSLNGPPRQPTMVGGIPLPGMNQGIPSGPNMGKQPLNPPEGPRGLPSGAVVTSSYPGGPSGGGIPYPGGFSGGGTSYPGGPSGGGTPYPGGKSGGGASYPGGPSTGGSFIIPQSTVPYPQSTVPYPAGTLPGQAGQIPIKVDVPSSQASSLPPKPSIQPIGGIQPLIGGIQPPIGGVPTQGAYVNIPPNSTSSSMPQPFAPTNANIIRAAGGGIAPYMPPPMPVSGTGGVPPYISTANSQPLGAFERDAANIAAAAAAAAVQPMPYPQMPQPQMIPAGVGFQGQPIPSAPVYPGGMTGGVPGGMHGGLPMGVPYSGAHGTPSPYEPGAQFANVQHVPGVSYPSGEEYNQMHGGAYPSYPTGYGAGVYPAYPSYNPYETGVVHNVGYSQQYYPGYGVTRVYRSNSCCSDEC